MLVFFANIKMESSTLIFTLLLTVFLCHQRTVGQGTECKNTYEDFSCEMFKSRGMCRMFKKYCALTCGTCQLPTSPPPTSPTTTRVTTTVVGGTTSQGWSVCSKTCGLGTRYRFVSNRCTNPNNRRCVKQFEECNRRLCPFEVCRGNEAPRYGHRRGCCNRRGPASPSQANRFSGYSGRRGSTWPWTVLVSVFGDICGGAIIHNEWVLTAAHCLTSGQRKISTSQIFVCVGIDNLKDATPQNRYHVKRTIIHSGYRNLQNDIALIQLSDPVQESNSTIISLPRRENTPIDSTCVLAGWGFSDILRPDLRSKPLQHEDQQILDFGVCRSQFSDDPIIGRHVSSRSPGLICAGSLTKRNRICDGYSGSPLVCQRCSSCDWYLAGITTTIRRGSCRKSGHPTLVTRVRSYESWILRYVRGLQQSNIRCPYKYGP